MSRTRLAVLFGGASSEHEISIRSATSVLSAACRERFAPFPVGVRRDGQWRYSDDPDANLQTVLDEGRPVEDLRALGPDIVFPVLHGRHGEDGALQGLLEMWGLPYVGSGVLASALCMDKVAQKQLIAAAAPGIPLLPWRFVDLRHQDRATIAQTLERAGDELGFPCFCKPANLGSSVGVSKCGNQDELRAALDLALRYDPKVVLERGIDAREIELAVLGSGDADTIVSAPGEIELPRGTWYDYESKYLRDVATYHLPAQLSAEEQRELQTLSLEAFRAAGCEGLARVDFLVDRRTQTPYLNEINTMPGFTSISMYPKLMEHTSVSYRELVTRLCDLGMRRHAAARGLSLVR